MASEYARALGARLRAIRTQQGLSLHGVEEKSSGRWKAVVVGSYERGDRAVTVARLAELAAFYGVPVAELLPGEDNGSRAVAADGAGPRPGAAAGGASPRRGPLLRFVAHIQRMRGDYNGRVLSIRQDDLQALALMYDRTTGELIEALTSWGVVATPSPS